MLLEPDAPVQVDVGWMPEQVAALRVRIGTKSWVAAGLCVLVTSWVVLSLASFADTRVQHTNSSGCIVCLRKANMACIV